MWRWARGGTCYVEDNYFADVIYRYSLRQAIEERFVKKVDYVAEMPKTEDADEKWQLILNRHLAWKKELKSRHIRPLSIIVTRDIKGCKLVTKELIEFLRKWEKLTLDQATHKVLPVTSAAEHQPNVLKLKTVDSPVSKVEWIVSVSMLSEGWDVKNVFLIIPHEERAFNSNLLIAQVLGRGLRRPEGWRGVDPVVTVFNHDAWSARIRTLVNEILEIERRLSAQILDGSPYHFDLHNLDYTRETDTTHYAKKGEYRLLEDGFVELPSQVESEDVEVIMERAITRNRTRFSTKLEHKTYSLEVIAAELFRRLQSIDVETKKAKDPKDRTHYAKKFPLRRCIEIVRASAKRANIKGGLTEGNRQRVLQALGPLHRKKAKRVRYRFTAKALTTLNTRERQAISSSASELRRGYRTAFFTAGCEKTIPGEQLEFFQEVQDRDGVYRAGREIISDAQDFRTPCNIAIADSTPERKFIWALCEKENAAVIDAWIKNAPQRFYPIEYAWKKGQHPKRGEFNPDFFIKKGSTILVIEIKDDIEIGDPSLENQKKYEYAQTHFALLNKWLKDAQIPFHYQHNWITPRSFNGFFQLLRENAAKGFRSDLDVALLGLTK